jgi:GT2 family glycosyltransferase
LSKITSEFFFITQPDVTIKKNCIENLIKSAKVYKDAAILSPVIYEEGLYSEFDFYNLKITKENKLSKNQKKKKRTERLKSPLMISTLMPSIQRHFLSKLQ